MSNTLVAVYGTLRKGYGNHRLLDEAKHIGEGRTVEKYKMTTNSYIPFVSKTPLTKITVEIYEVTDDELARLDRLEGHPEWYKREKINIELDTGESKDAWLYFNDAEGSNTIISGDYNSQ